MDEDEQNADHYGRLLARTLTTAILKDHDAVDVTITVTSDTDNPRGTVTTQPRRQDKAPPTSKRFKVSVRKC